MPAKATNTIQFVTGGDCGTGKHAVLSNILAAKQEPYFTFIGGDLAYDNGRSAETFLKFVHNYAQHMIDPLGRLIPLLVCPGNHEVNGGYSNKRSAAPHYLSVFDGLYKETSYDVLDFGDYLSLVMLDTGHLSPIKGAQTDWLAATLAARQERPHLLVANHVPAYPSYRPTDKTGADNRSEWCPLFEKYRVDAVLEHHDHTFKRQAHPSAQRRLDRQVWRALPRRWFLGPDPRAATARKASLPGDVRLGISRQRASSGRRNAISHCTLRSNRAAKSPISTPRPANAPPNAANATLP
jgi:hypothetical protein